MFCWTLAPTRQKKIISFPSTTQKSSPSEKTSQVTHSWIPTVCHDSQATVQWQGCTNMQRDGRIGAKKEKKKGCLDSRFQISSLFFFVLYWRSWPKSRITVVSGSWSIGRCVMWDADESVARSMIICRLTRHENSCSCSCVGRTSWKAGIVRGQRWSLSETKRRSQTTMVLSFLTITTRGPRTTHGSRRDLLCGWGGGSVTTDGDPRQELTWLGRFLVCGFEVQGWGVLLSK